MEFDKRIRQPGEVVAPLGHEINVVCKALRAVGNGGDAPDEEVDDSVTIENLDEPA